VSHRIPQRDTEPYSVTQGYTASHRAPWRHKESHSPTASHRATVSDRAAQCHTESHSVTQSYTVTQNSTASHRAPQRRTESHSVTQSPTVSRRAFSVTEPHSVTDSAVENVDHHVEILRVQSRAASHKARRNREPARQYSAKLDALPVSDNTLQAPWKSRLVQHRVIWSSRYATSCQRIYTPAYLQAPRAAWNRNSGRLKVAISCL